MNKDFENEQRAEMERDAAQLKAKVKLMASDRRPKLELHNLLVLCWGLEGPVCGSQGETKEGATLRPRVETDTEKSAT